MFSPYLTLRTTPVTNLKPLMTALLNQTCGSLAVYLTYADTHCVFLSAAQQDRHLPARRFDLSFHLEGWSF